MLLQPLQAQRQPRSSCAQDARQHAAGRQQQGRSASGGRQQPGEQQERRPKPAQPKQQPQQQQQEAGGEQEALHPSWAARKAQKLSIGAAGAAGAAKKVVFGEDGEMVAVRQAPQAGPKPATSKPQQEQQRQHKGPDRQRQQQQQHGRGRQQQGALSKAAGGQQGSRAPAGVPPEQLHPSWQAKKAQQAAIKLQPAGKKVVFDD